MFRAAQCSQSVPAEGAALAGLVPDALLTWLL